MTILILNYKVEINASILLRWHKYVCALEFLEHYRFSISFVIRSHCEFNFLTNVFKEDFLLKDLTSLLKVRDITLLGNHNTKWSKDSEFVSFRMATSAVTVEAKVTVSTLLALEAICLDWVHVALIAGDTFMNVRFH